MVPFVLYAFAKHGVVNLEYSYKFSLPSLVLQPNVLFSSSTLASSAVFHQNIFEHSYYGGDYDQGLQVVPVPCMSHPYHCII